MSRLETVRVSVKDGTDYVTINKSEYDFDPSKYELFEQLPPKNFRSLSELRRILQQVDTLEAVEALEIEENGRLEGPRKGGLTAIEDRKADFAVVDDESEDEDTSSEE